MNHHFITHNVLNNFQISFAMKSKDETNNLVLENPTESLAKRICALEHQFSMQNNAIKQQIGEMQDYCKFFTSLYSDLKLDFIQTKQLLLGKISSEDLTAVQGTGLEANAWSDSERIKELEEEVKKLKLENSVLKEELCLKENGMQQNSEKAIK